MASPGESSIEEERFVIEELQPQDYPSVLDTCTSVFCSQNEFLKFLNMSSEAWHAVEAYDTQGWEKSGLSLVARDRKADNAIAAFLVVVPSTYLKPDAGPGYWEKIYAISPGIRWVGEVDFAVKLSAFMSKAYRHASWLTGYTCRVACGGTKAAYEGKGLGGRLRTRLVELARARGYDAIQVETISPMTQHIWNKKLGFEILARQKFSEYQTGDGSFPLQGMDGEYTLQQKVLRHRPFRDLSRIWMLLIGFAEKVLKARCPLCHRTYITSLRYIALALGSLWVRSVE